MPLKTSQNGEHLSNLVTVTKTGILICRHRYVGKLLAKRYFSAFAEIRQ